MTTENLYEQYPKALVFKEEIEHISTNAQPLIAAIIQKLPDYFFEVPASSTGKYHPSYTQGNGGLVRHTKAAARIAIELLRLEMYQSLLPAKDYIIMALLLHDGWKHGMENERGQYTVSEHPKVCADWLRRLAGDAKAVQPVFDYVADLVLTHMGQWNLSYNSGQLFAPKPQTQEQAFVHLCDYLASRKMLEMNFDVPFGV